MVSQPTENIEEYPASIEAELSEAAEIVTANSVVPKKVISAARLAVRHYGLTTAEVVARARELSRSSYERSRRGRMVSASTLMNRVNFQDNQELGEI